MGSFPKALLAFVAVAWLGAGLAAPADAQPPVRPGDSPRPEERSQQPVQASDAHRIVGKVVRIDRDEGLAALATTEGVLTVQVPSPMLHAIRVGDTITVPRSAAESPSASPRRSR
jgi:hypothetical protein